MEYNKQATFIADILSDKKALDINVLKISELTTMADYFVICTGSSTTQVKALADNVVEKMSDEGVEPLRIEGYKSCTWVLIDYGSTIVHIFKSDMRDFYNLDRLWGDAEKIVTQQHIE